MSDGTSDRRPTLNVFFTFEESWEVGPSPSAGANEPQLTKLGGSLPSRIGRPFVVFPPGPPKTAPEPGRDFTLSPEQGVVIAPLDLTGLNDAEIVAILSERAEAIALVAQAIVVAQTQLAAAVAALKR